MVSPIPLFFERVIPFYILECVKFEKVKNFTKKNLNDWFLKMLLKILKERKSIKSQIMFCTRIKMRF